MHDKPRQQRVDRRSGTDRRSWNCQLEFPYIDSHGTLVTEDRRKRQRRDIIARVKSASAN